MITCPCLGLCMSGSLSVRCALRALAEPAAGQDSNGMHCRHLALLGSRTGEARASVGTAPSNRHIRGMTWRRSLCGSGCAGRPSIGVRVRMLRCGPDCRIRLRSGCRKTCWQHSYCWNGRLVLVRVVASQRIRRRKRRRVGLYLLPLRQDVFEEGAGPVQAAIALETYHEFKGGIRWRQKSKRYATSGEKGS